MNYRYYLAPAWHNPEDNSRTVGFSSVADKTVSIPGCRHLWPAGQPVQIENASSPAGWVRMTVAVVPPDQMVPDAVYACLCLRSADLTRVTPEEVIFLAPDPGSPPEWKRLSLVITDLDFWSKYGESYFQPGSGQYYAADYRATVVIPEGRHVLAPPTWVEITRAEAVVRHPDAGL